MQILVVVALSLFITGTFFIVQQQIYWFERSSKNFYKITNNKMLFEKAIAYGIAFLDNQKSWRQNLLLNKNIIIKPNFLELVNSKISVELHYMKKSKNIYLLKIFVFSLNNILYECEIQIKYEETGELKEIIKNFI